MELKEYLTLVRHWWWLLLVGAVLGAGAGYLYADRLPLPSSYQAKTTLMFGDDNLNPNAITAHERLARSYAEMIRRQPILQAAIENLEIDTNWTSIQGLVTGQLVPNTQLFEIYVRHSDPDHAILIADEIARQLIRQFPSTSDPDQEVEVHRTFVKGQLDELQAKISDAQQQIKELEVRLDLETTPEGIQRRREEIAAWQAKINSWQGNYASLLSFIQQDKPLVYANRFAVIEPAIITSRPVQSRDNTREILMGGVIGLAIAAAIAFVLEYIDDTVKTSEDVQRVLDLPTLGTIPKISSSTDKIGTGAKTLTRTHEQSFSPFAEAYRTLRTNIQFSSLLMTNTSTTLLITSSGAGEGKSTTAANLALVMAQGGKQVILVDTDLRRPVLQTFFDVDNKIGLTNLLVNDNLVVEEALADSGVSNLRLLPSGPLPPNSADILGTPQMEQRIAQLAQCADLVIFDSPPVLVVTDASILAKQVDSTLLVIEAGRTRRQVCQKSKEALEQIGAKIAGVILNRFNPRKDVGYGYGYGYYYSSKNGRDSQNQMKQQKVLNKRGEER